MKQYCEKNYLFSFVWKTSISSLTLCDKEESRDVLYAKMIALMSAMCKLVCRECVGGNNTGRKVGVDRFPVASEHDIAATYKFYILWV